MADDDRRTPEIAERTADRWRNRGFLCLAAAFVLSLFDLGGIALLPMGALVLCMHESGFWYGWRRGHLDRKEEESQDAEHGQVSR